MFPVIDFGKCEKCLGCVDVCPNQMFEIDEEDTPFVVFDNVCAGCCDCMNQCPTGAISFED